MHSPFHVIEMTGDGLLQQVCIKRRNCKVCLFSPTKMNIRRLKRRCSVCTRTPAIFGIATVWLVTQLHPNIKLGNTLRLYVRGDLWKG